MAMPQQAYFLPDEAATEAFGRALGHALAARLSEPPRIHLEGGLGTGKSSLARSVIRALGHAGAVPSPTYTLVEIYEDCRPPVVHMDLYRLSDPEELEFLGIRELDERGLVWLVEWPERGEGVLPPPGLRIRLTQQDRGRHLLLAWGASTAEPIREQLMSDELLKEYAVSC